MNGSVLRGKKLKLKEAQDLRKKGYDIVVCGPDFTSNRVRAEMIERNANGNVVLHAPHPNAGANALYHFQPDPRGPRGHTFFESVERIAR